MPTPRKTAKGAKRTCAAKQAYPSRGDAIGAAKAMERRTGSRFRVYRCEVGSKGSPRHWHVTHSSRTRKPGRAW